MWCVSRAGFATSTARLTCQVMPSSGSFKSQQRAQVRLAVLAAVVQQELTRVLVRHAACSGAAAEATGPSFVLHHNVHVCVAIWSSRYGWARQAAARVACTCPDAARSLAGVGVPTGCRAPLRLHPTLCGVACDQPEAVELTGVPSGRHHPRVATDICSSDTLREVACGRFPRCVCGAGGLAFARVCTPLLVRA